MDYGSLYSVSYEVFIYKERKFLDIPILKKYADYAPPDFWKEFPSNLDPPEEGKLTEINMEVIIICLNFP